ncbi:MAG: hypothetical protein AAB595_00795 [Patescibacteria group bacterium]
MDDTVDSLKIKIEKAKRGLSLETVNAIDAVDWKMAILGLREKKGYTFEQLGDLELETELLLSGLVSPENYPGELEKRMKISGVAVNELINEMNDLVFKKIREELVKNIERKKIFQRDSDIQTPKEDSATQTKSDLAILNKAGIEIVEKRELFPEIMPAGVPFDVSREEMLKKIEKPDTILTQKLSASVQIPIVKTEHSLENITKTTPPSSYPPKRDPYRLSPDE